MRYDLDERLAPVEREEHGIIAVGATDAVVSPPTSDKGAPSPLFGTYFPHM